MSTGRRLAATLLLALLASSPPALAQAPGGPLVPAPPAEPEAKKPAADAPTAPAGPARLRLAFDGSAELQVTEIPTIKEPQPFAGVLPPGTPLGPWRMVCRAPCETTADPKVLYRVGGSAIAPSPPFQIPAGVAQATVEVEPGRKIWLWTGIGIAAVGAAMLIGGSVLYFAKGSQTTVAGGAQVRDQATYLVLASPLFLVAGGVLWGQNRETLVSVDF